MCLPLTKIWFLWWKMRNMKEEEYRGNILYEFVSSLQYYLRGNTMPVDFLFVTNLRSVVDA